jgi:phosphatidylglycerol:prolipoprotein diacylglycerol transferase
LNGCCYGDRCDLPGLAVRFPRDSPPWLAERAQDLIPRDAPASLPLHPTQLYASLDGLVLLGLLSAYYPLRRRDGEVIGLLMLTYPVSRFLIERLRNDESALIGSLTVAQVVSLLLLLAGMLFWAWLPDRKVAGSSNP